MFIRSLIQILLYTSSLYKCNFIPDHYTNVIVYQITYTNVVIYQTIYTNALFTRRFIRMWLYSRWLIRMFLNRTSLDCLLRRVQKKGTTLTKPSWNCQGLFELLVVNSRASFLVKNNKTGVLAKTSIYTSLLLGKTNVCWIKTNVCWVKTNVCWVKTNVCWVKTKHLYWRVFVLICYRMLMTNEDLEVQTIGLKLQDAGLESAKKKSPCCNL